MYASPVTAEWGLEKRAKGLRRKARASREVEVLWKSIYSWVIIKDYVLICLYRVRDLGYATLNLVFLRFLELLQL